MPTRTPTLVAVGPWEAAEFAALRAEVDPQLRWPIAAELSEVTAALRRGNEQRAATPSSATPPEAVLLAQPRPGSVGASQLEQLRSVAPLVRVIVVAGTWCEGELRTGQPPAGVVRLYWYEFAPWWRAACAAWEQNETPAWSEPLDDARAGQQTPLAERRGSLHVSDAAHQPAIAIDAVDYAVFETLAAALAPLGWRCEWAPRRRPTIPLAAPPAAAIWDGGQLSEAEQRSLAAFSQRIHETNPAAPVIALLDFPRVEHLQTCRAAGAAGVLGKPYQVAQLANELDRFAMAGRASSS